MPWHKTYKVTDNAWSNKALKVKHGKAEKEFPMDIVSNQPVTQVSFKKLFIIHITYFSLSRFTARVFPFFNDFRE